MSTENGYDPAILEECEACEEYRVCVEVGAVPCPDGFQLGVPGDPEHKRQIFLCLRAAAHPGRHQSCADDEESGVQIHPAMLWKRGAVRGVMTNIAGTTTIVVGNCVNITEEPGGSDDQEDAHT